MVTTEELVIRHDEHLKSINGDIGEIKQDISFLRKEVKEIKNMLICGLFLVALEALLMILKR